MDIVVGYDLGKPTDDLCTPTAADLRTCVTDRNSARGTRCQDG
jgi:hypothetical protein